MLRFNPREIKSRDMVSSHTENTYNQNIDWDIKELYTRASKSIGLSNYLGDITSVAEETSFRFAIETLDRGNGILLSPTGTNILYPSTIKKEWQADIDSATKHISLHHIEDIPQFTEWNAVLGKYTPRSRMYITRKSDNRLVKQDVEIVEPDGGPIKALLTSTPYVVRITGDTTFGNVNLTFTLGRENMKGNTIRVVPYPSVGNTEIDYMTFMNEEKQPIPTYKIDGTTRLSIDKTDPLNYTTPGYMTMLPIEFNNFRISLTSRYLCGATGGYHPGIQYISVDDVLYSTQSYIGWEVDTSNLSNITAVSMLPSRIDQSSVENVTYWFYDNEVKFHALSTDYLSRNEVPHSVSEFNTLWFLIKIERQNDTSPVIRGIRLGVEE